MNNETQLTVSIETQAFELAQRQAKALATSTLVPREFQGNPANCLIALNMAQRMKADPFMVMQSLDIIHGRPSFRAQFLIAMVNASGRFSPLQFKFEGEGKSRSCQAYATSRETGEVCSGPVVTWAMAEAEGWTKKNGSKWQTMADLMFTYRAGAFFARIYAPDITLGLHTTEEIMDIEATNMAPRDVTPNKVKPIDPFPKAAKPVIAESGDMFAAEVPPVPVLDVVKSKLAEAKIEFHKITQDLLDNGILEDKRNNPDDCTDDELRAILAAMPSIVAAQKGGAA